MGQTMANTTSKPFAIYFHYATFFLFALKKNPTAYHLFLIQPTLALCHKTLSISYQNVLIMNYKYSESKLNPPTFHSPALLALSLYIASPAAIIVRTRLAAFVLI